MQKLMTHATNTPIKGRKEKPLFRTFLHSPQQHGRLKSWWKKQFLSHFPDAKNCDINWYKEPHRNGKPLRDGNPIFAAYVPSVDKNIRIIQHEAENNEEAYITTWTDEKYYQERLVPELVMVLTLSQRTAQEAFAYMREWQREA
jgi:hypothetical protein